MCTSFDYELHLLFYIANYINFKKCESEVSKLSQITIFFYSELFRWWHGSILIRILCKKIFVYKYNVSLCFVGNKEKWLLLISGVSIWFNSIKEERKFVPYWNIIIIIKGELGRSRRALAKAKLESWVNFHKSSSPPIDHPPYTNWWGASDSQTHIVYDLVPYCRCVSMFLIIVDF